MIDQHSDPQCGFVQETLRLVAKHIPGTTQSQLAAIEHALRTEYGGRKVYVAATNRPRVIDSGRHAAIYQDGLTTDTNEAIMSRHGISRATLYRLMKRPPANT
jgi:hypothetical protein